MRRWLSWLFLAWLSFFIAACSTGGDPVEQTTPPADSGRDAGEGFVVGGHIEGLKGKGLVVRNGDEDLPIAIDGTFVFDTRYPNGTSFDVRVKSQPIDPTQNCVIAGGAGVVNGHVTTVTINCTTTGFTIGGLVSGLSGSGLLLSMDGGATVSITSNGVFAFPTPVLSGTKYKITVLTEPKSPSQECTIKNGEGTVGNAPVSDIAVECKTKTFKVGGVASGLEGTGLVLQNNGGDDLTVAANGAFSFTTPLASGTAYAVTAKTQPGAPIQTCVVGAGSGTVVDGDVTSVTVTCTTNTYAIKGTVAGLAGTGLLLQNNGADDLPITADGTFEFTTKVKSGSSFNISVKTQPSGPSQTCTVAGGAGSVVASDVTSVLVNCANDRFTIGGTVTGLAGSGLVLQSGTDELSIGANGSFAFSKPLTAGTFYNVIVKTQPTSPMQTCSIVGGAGTVGSGNVTSIVVNCSATRVVVGGTISGLSGSGLVIQNNGADDLRLTGNGTFGFATTIASGGAYLVSVKTAPTGPSQTCTVTNAGGTAGTTNVTTVSISCVTDVFPVGGTVTGLSGSGLVLQNNSGDDLTVTGDGPFTFPTRSASGTSYKVTVKTSPSSPTQVCTITGGGGTVGGGPVTSVVVTCTTSRFTVGGMVSGLTGSGLVLRNNLGDDLPIAGNGAFVFATPIKSGDAYSVTIKSQPTSPSQTCAIVGGAGTVTSANIASVAITCTTNTYQVGGSVSGLLGGGLVLQNNLGDDLTIGANGTFNFPTRVASGGAYSVTVKTQPSAPSQTCAITGGTGVVGGGAVASVVVNCATDAFTVGGRVTGLDGTGLRLLLNGSTPLEITSNGTFAFSKAISSGAMYAVTVDAQPTSNSQTCTVTSGSGTVGSANVDTVQVTCVTNTYPIAVNVSGLSGSGLVVRNNTENLSISGNGETSFVTKVASGSGYSVTVVTQPSGPSQTCTVASGAGTVSGAKVVVSVTCTTNSFTVGGTVTGLATDAPIVLRNQAGVDLTITGTGATSMPFTFPTPVLSGSTYSVIVQSRPTAPISQNCTVTSGSGTMAGANVTSVAVNCTTNTFTVRASVIGMSGGTLVLQNNGGSDLTFAGNGTLAFSPKLASGSAYAVTVKTQPVGQVCKLSVGSGTIGDSDVTVNVNCSTNYTVGGTITGLAGGSVVLQNNGADDVTVSGTGTFTFTFPTPLTTSQTYAVTVKTHPGSPKWQTCTIANASGTIGTSNVTNVAVTCTTNTYSIGGTVTGLASGGSVVLQNNLGDNLTVTAAGSFTFPTKIASGATYSATVLTNPSSQTCTVASGTGTVAGANITTVTVTCVNNYSVGGTITGLYGDGLVLRLTAGGVTSYDTITRNAPSTTFTFAKLVPSGTSYSVAVITQPTKYVQTCTVSSGASGTISGANVTSVGVSCGAVSSITITQSAFIGASSPAQIPDNTTGDCTADNLSTATPLKSEIVIAGNHFAVGKVTVTLNGLQHTWLGDLKARVELDRSAVILASTSLFSRPGRYTDTPTCGSSASVSGNYGFDDTAAQSLWSSTAGGVTYHPVGPRANSSVTGFTFLQSTAPSGFAGSTTNGTWRLVLTDHNIGDVGTITSWTLTLSP